MDRDTRELLRSSIRALLDSEPGDLLAGLSEFGWAEVVSDDEAEAVDLLFTAQGGAGVASAALDAVMVAAAAGDLEGTDPATPPVVVHPLGQTQSTITAGRLYVDGVVHGAPPSGRMALVAESTAGSEVYALAPDQWPTASVVVRGFDPASGLHRVRLDLPIDDVARCASDWTSATAAARRALASELVGNARAMLTIAVEQVGQRTQFGRPIGANQTPRHRLADAYVQVSAAHELVHVAWVSRSPWDALVAKTYAGSAAETTAGACMQVCGAIGLSLEHPLGAYVKRSRVLDALYGGWEISVHDIGKRLLDTRIIPAGPHL